MKSNYRVRAEKLIRRIYDEYPYLKRKHSPADVRKCIQQYNENHHSRIMVYNGAARCAIVYSDYVIKFDYGCNNKWAGGCEDEYMRYNDIISHSKYSYLFAEITKIEINGSNFYIMPRVEGVGSSQSYFDKLTEQERKFIFSVTADIHGYNYGRFNKKIRIIDYAMAP